MNESRQGSLRLYLRVENHEDFYQKRSLKVLKSEWKELQAGERNTAHSRKTTNEKAIP